MWPVLVGCVLPPVPSTDVATRDLSLSIDVEGTDLGAAVSIAAFGPEGEVRFAGTDRLWLAAGDREIPVTDGMLVEESPLVLHLDRAGDHDLAIPLPVAAPLEPSATVAAEGLSLTWEPAPDGFDVEIALSGTCIAPLARELLSDTGSYRISPAEVDTAGACPVEVAVVATLALDRLLVPGRPGGRYFLRSTRRDAVEVAWGS